MRLIDADALKIRDISPSYWQVVDGLTEYDIEDAPTVDAVPVIRCKDCKYYEHGENPSETWSTCTAHINRYIETCADNFCAWAERKEP